MSVFDADEVEALRKMKAWIAASSPETHPYVLVQLVNLLLKVAERDAQHGEHDE
jgi:hypothetical protein